MANNPKTVVIVDGENLAIRYKAMVNDGYKSMNNVDHEEDIFVWSRDLFQEHNTEKDILRISYFTCVTGDRDRLDAWRERIGQIKYSCTVGLVGRGGGRMGGTQPITTNGTLNPRVFAKQKGLPSKKIDIAMVIDAINYSMVDNIDEIHIMSGDSDFIPVIHEIMRRGKKVTVSSFSKGVNAEMRHTPDAYECLDDIFFDKKEEVEKPTPSDQC